ncbi:MAG: hypothetical protein ACYDH1_18460 [Anaerolineaceae bacterium]
MNLFDSPKNKIKRETVYEEMNIEMRRHRDYELNSSNWYTAILIALNGGLITLKINHVFVFTDEKVLNIIPSFFCNFLQISFPFVLLQIYFYKLILSILFAVIGSLGIYTVHYSSKRYKHMRKWFNKNMEPDWKNYDPEDLSPNIAQVIAVMLTILVIIAWSIIWFPF